MNYNEIIYPRGPLGSDVLEILHPYFGTLPMDYVDFLIKTNGGTVKKNYFLYDADQEGFVDEFFGILDLTVHNTHDLRWYALYFEHRPADTVQIGTDEAGYFILLSTSEDKYGTIYLYHRAEGRCDWVAPSFTEFMKMLKYDPEGL